MIHSAEMTSSKIEYQLKAAFERRFYLYESNETDCFRIFNSSGDGIEGLVLDYYAGYYLVQYFNEEVAYNIEKIFDFITAIAGSLSVPVYALLCKSRIPVSGNVNNSGLYKSVIVSGSYPENDIVVKQNGIRCCVNLMNGQNTGVFLDMREFRKSLSSFYRDTFINKMINLFSYTCLFSVHGLKNGIKHSVNVDLSKNVLKRGRKNYHLNYLAVDKRDFIYGDALEWVKIFTKKDTGFDLAVFDPPTFARNRGGSFSAKNDYSGALSRVGKLVPGGYAITSVNSFSISEEEYRLFHPRNWDILMFGNESSDFVTSGKPYLKVGLWKIK